MTEEIHISEVIADLLIEDGFIFKNGEYQCYVKGFAPAGEVSDGTRLVRITISETGRWLERLDGWNKVEQCVDLREYYSSRDAIGAIEAVMKR